MPSQSWSKVFVPEVKQSDDEGKLSIKVFLIMAGRVEADSMGFEGQSIGDLQQFGILRNGPF
jgi:hypothetical protein